MTTNPVTVLITCAIKREMLDTAKRELEAVIQIVMANEPACQGVRVHHDSKTPERLMIIEHWESEEIFTGPHMQTAHMQTFLKKAEEFLDGAAQFSFWEEILVVQSPESRGA
jgi:quinol monooxygenase YgiN